MKGTTRHGKETVLRPLARSIIKRYLSVAYGARSSV